MFFVNHLTIYKITRLALLIAADIKPKLKIMPAR